MERLGGQTKPSAPAWRAVRRTALGVLWILICLVFVQLQPPRPLASGRHQKVTSLNASGFWYPIERNAHRRLPSVTAGKLNSIQMLDDGRRGWAVGSDGTVITTRDGGRSWAAQVSPIHGDLTSVHFDPNGRRGWAVGGNENGTATMIATADGGRTWAAQRTPASGGSSYAPRLSTVDFASDGQRGWAVGVDTVLVTTDGGRNWTVVNAREINHYLASVHFAPDGRRGWAVGSDGTVIATSDGGMSWSAQISSTHQALSCVDFAPDGLHGWAAGDGGTVIATRDSGTHWAVQRSTTRSNLHSIHFAANGLHGWAVGEQGTVIATADGGTTWAAQSSGTDASLQSVHFASDGRRGWVVGEQGTVIATADGGRHWAAQSRSAEVLSSVDFLPDRLHGWAVGDDGTVIATADGGGTWIAQSSPTKSFLHSVHFAPDGLHGWATGADGTLIATADGGRTWTAKGSPADQDLHSFDFAPDGRRGWAVGNTGTVAATTDGGETWDEDSHPTREDLYSVDFAPGGLHGWAVGAWDTVIATTDGGKTWTGQDVIGPVLPGRPESNYRGPLFSVHSAADGLHGWAVGSDGTVIATPDGGRTWRGQSSGTDASLQSVHFTPDGGRGWAVGEHGTVIATNDGGRTWTLQSSPAHGNLLSVEFASDGLTGWAVGDHSTVITTRDGGRTWANAELPYRRWPAPWFWVALLPGFGMLVLAHRERRLPDRESVADVGVSDGAITRARDDVLDFAPLARGISRFLRNEQTSAPLTLAITGDWGTGKSSLMQLLCADLRQYGHRPIWFNAWHYQKEEHLFAALLAAIRAELAPPVWSLSFRLKLLWLRSKRNAAWALVLTVATAALVGWLVTHPTEQWQLLDAWLSKLTQILSALGRLLAGEPSGAHPESTAPPAISEGGGAGDLSWLLPAQLGTLLAVLVGLRRALTAIGADPAALLAGAAKSFTLRDAEAQSTLRMRFAKEFAEVAEALPQRMVIVIDDLDRCKPEAVLEIVEAVNFLTSAGECYVIFGMATERVQAALSIAFERIARELADAELGTAAGSGENPDAERVKRRAYARDYLQKLINIEIQVPNRHELNAHQLLTPQHKPLPQSWMRATQTVCQSLPVFVAAAAIAAGLWLGAIWYLPETQPMTRSTASSAAAPTAPRPATPPAPAKDANSQPGTPSPSRPQAHLPTAGSAELRPGETSRDTLYWGLLPLGLGLLLALALVLRLLREQATRVQDSEAFRRALQLWTPLVALDHNTPRAIKRFGNRIRFLAMLQQGAEHDRTVAEQMLHGLRAWWPDARKPKQQALFPAQTLDEPQLIALGAIHEVFGPRWREVARSASGSEERGGGTDKLLARLPGLVQQHGIEFDYNWPPSEQDLQVFERLLAGVRLSGDTETARRDGSVPLPAT